MVKWIKWIKSSTIERIILLLSLLLLYFILGDAIDIRGVGWFKYVVAFTFLYYLLKSFFAKK